VLATIPPSAKGTYCVLKFGRLIELDESEYYAPIVNDDMAHAIVRHTHTRGRSSCVYVIVFCMYICDCVLHVYVCVCV
jgi:hypothetical protein